MLIIIFKDDSIIIYLKPGNSQGKKLNFIRSLELR